MECICIYEMYGYSLSFVFLESGKAVRSERRFVPISCRIGLRFIGGSSNLEYIVSRISETVTDEAMKWMWRTTKKYPLIPV